MALKDDNPRVHQANLMFYGRELDYGLNEFTDEKGRKRKIKCVAVGNGVMVAPAEDDEI